MRIQDTRFVVLDTETTGLDPAEDRVVEISLVEVSRRGIHPLFDTLINPGREIPCTASAVHHITNRHVVGKPSLDDVWPVVLGHVQDAVIVAHNAPFDRSMLPDTGRPWLCSLRFARHLWPQAPAHSNQVLRYWLDLQIETETGPHSAAADTLVTAHVFRSELVSYRKDVATTDSVEDLLAYVESPIRVEVMSFGKHKGKRLKDVPTDYLSWLLRETDDQDPDLRATLASVLEERR